MMKFSSFNYIWFVALLHTLIHLKPKNNFYGLAHSLSKLIYVKKSKNLCLIEGITILSVALLV